MPWALFFPGQTRRTGSGKKIKKTKVKYLALPHLILDDPPFANAGGPEGFFYFHSFPFSPPFVENTAKEGVRYPRRFFFHGQDHPFVTKKGGERSE